ncbi:MAG: hypothetical protein J6T73_04740, partial [Clostridia bacterium]|nr:hypothetical protein [Clostridia bacterium]
GNGNFVSYVVNAEGGAGWSVADGVLHLDITNGQWLRTWNNINGLEAYKYMVVRMKGTNSWGESLTGNSISFKFGSAGSQTTVLSATAEQLTEDYSYAYIEIPNPSTFYSAVTAENYRYSLWIGTQRGAQFSVDIDEIFFTNDEPGSSTEPEEPGEPVEEDKLLYIDFNSGLGDSYDTRTPTGNTGNEAYAVSAEGGAVWSVDNGALNLKVTNGQWLRTWNTITGLDDYRYMVLRMKGSYDWGGNELTGNALSFKFGSAGSQTAVLSMSADKLTEDYSDVVIDIPDNFFTAAADNGYRYSIWIGTERGASFDVYIDEIYFTNTAASEETPDDESFIDVPINKSNVKFLGRTGGSDASNRLVLEWLNSGFSFNFTGSAFEFNVAGTQQDSRLQPYVAYSVDGGELNYIKVVSSSSQNIRVSGLSEGNHSVKIIRTNEPIGNPIYVSDLKISSALQTASVGAPDTASDMKILFIGDSLTTAYGNTGSGNHPYTTDEQDGTKGYAYLTAEHFGADAQYVAREGRGLVNNNYDGYTDYANDMFGVESYVLGTDYDFGSWTPGLVVINLGSNDEQGKPNKTTQTEMHNAVKAFLSRVRGLYPNADIIWAYDTLATSDGGNVKSGIVSAIQEFNDAKVRFCSLSTITGLGTYGHPNVDEHRTLANDLIYYIENPSETTLPGTSEVVYSEFTEQLVLGSSVSNGAGGSIELFGLQDGASQDVKNGALDLSLSGPDAYIRFRSSVILSDGTNSKYKYMGIRIKGGAVRSDGTAVTGNMINVIFASWGNEGNPVVITGNRVSGSEYTDIILALSDANFANSHPDYLSGLILRNAGNFNTSVQIDRIYFTNEKPEDSGTDDPETPVTPTPAQGNADHVYSEFTTPLVEGTAVDNGADGTITLFAIDGGTQTVSGGSLNLKLNGEGSYIRFTSSLALSDGTNSKYKYMVIRMKGGAARADGSAVTGN